jgi:hypothetical protein
MFTFLIMNFEIKKKVLKNATQVTILADGVEIGKRTSARNYRFALICANSQDYALESYKQQLRYAEKSAARYQAVVNDEPGAREKFINFDDNGKLASAWVRKCNTEFIADGSVARFLDINLKQIEKAKAMIARLSSGPQPEYQKPYVSSWHQTRENVASVRPSQVFITVLEIPE